MRAQEWIIEWWGQPQVMGSDTGAEYIGRAFVARAECRSIGLDHTQPGNPQQNVCIERYNRTVRYNRPSHYLFESVEEVHGDVSDGM